MIYKAQELLTLGESEYSIRNKVSSGKLFLVDRGIYSDKNHNYVNEAFICKKYKKAILTGLSAFYIYGLTDYIPDKFYLATKQHSFPIRKDNVSQIYQDKSFFEVGKKTMEYDGGIINIYDMERLLIELVRLKSKYPAELYYEVLSSFRKNKDKLDFYKINEYSKKFKNNDSLLRKIKEIL